MSDFKGDDYEFAAGSIHGMRSWGMDDLGRLHGVTHAEVWKPGENVSTCKATVRVPCPERAKDNAKKIAKRRERDMLYDSYGIYREFYGEPRSCGAAECLDWTHPAPTTHTFDPACECGFWAYDDHTFTAHGDVSGIIQGYGKTTIGTRGFRCEKAQIVALCRGRSKDSRLSLSAWLRLQQLYPAAKFYEGTDEMVSRHGAVLRCWPEVGEDFWTKKVKTKGGSWGSLSAASLSASPMRWSIGRRS